MLWRIRDRATFEALRRSSERARRGAVTVTYAPVGEAPVPRVAYAVGKRVGNAVIRNRVRRRLRAAAETVELTPGAYLVAAGPGATGAAWDDLKRDVADAMTSAAKAPRP
ncbi:MAG: ribonuclease P protein component [Acidimicrobiales bacterium]